MDREQRSWDAWRAADIVAATLLRAWLSVGPIRLAVRNAGEAAVREALTTALAPLRTSTGGYRIEDEYRYAIT